MAVLTRAILLLIFFKVSAIACTPHTNLILCWEAQEGEGLVLRDESPSGATGIFTNGPAWATGPIPQSFSTNSAVNVGNYMVSIPGTFGVDVETGVTALFDFSAGKSFILGINFQVPARISVDNPELVVYSNAAGTNGFMLEILTATDRFNLKWNAVANKNAPVSIPDTNPHRLLFIRTAATIYWYLDGQFKGITADGSNPLGPAISSLKMGSGIGGGGGIIKLGGLVIYNFAPQAWERDAFAFNDWVRYQPSRIGVTR